MHKKGSLIVTLVAWLLATGSHWDLIQTFAWGTMIASYSETMPFADAVKKTFSPETMCRLCHAVADAKKAADSNPAVPNEKVPGKILLVCTPVASTLFAPPVSQWLLATRASVPTSADRADPPVPPPRVLA